MPKAERECPICYRQYTWDRLRAGPNDGKCSHGFCEDCGEMMAEAVKECPVRCPVCRHDITAWFADYFNWASAEEQKEAYDAEIRRAQALLVR